MTIKLNWCGFISKHALLLYYIHIMECSTHLEGSLIADGHSWCFAWLDHTSLASSKEHQGNEVGLVGRKENIYGCHFLLLLPALIYYKNSLSLLKQ